MPVVGWQKLIPPPDSFRGEGNYPIPAYSEFLPPPCLVWKPYGGREPDAEIVRADDPYGWYVSEFAEARELETGLVKVGEQIVHKLAKLVDNHHNADVVRSELVDNPYWSGELSAAMPLAHERCVTLLPLALSRTQDDKGRMRWTLFGNSEQGPGKAFWKSFYTAPNQELPVDEAVAFFCRLLHTVYGEHTDGIEELRAAGFRILPDPKPRYDFWTETLPSWTESLVLSERTPADGVKYLLTFRPFGQIPAALRKAYLAGKLVLLPFPGSLIFWGVPGYRRLHEELPFALQIPLLLAVARHQMPEGIRVPQSGYLHVPTEDRPHPHAHTHHIRDTYKRTHRWDKVLRDADELALIDREEKLLHVLFSTIPEDISLYDKPMARNAQVWTEEYRLLMNGPDAAIEEMKNALRTMEAGGLFGYRFQFPAMRAGLHEVYWHRPLVAYRNAAGDPEIVHDAPTGYFTAYVAGKPRLDKPVELWPRTVKRSIAATVLHLQPPGPGRSITPMVRSVNKLLDAHQKRGGRPLPRARPSTPRRQSRQDAGELARGRTGREPRRGTARTPRTRGRSVAARVPSQARRFPSPSPIEKPPRASLK